jgi:DNA-binding transcriptional regulator GbsR (MarR family)
MVELPDDAIAAHDLVIDTFGRIIEFWGFTRTMGRIFGLLYLSAEPLSLQDICDRLSISAGNASMTLNGLLRWGVVRKVWIKGERRDFYEPETDFWKMIAGVLNERERREIRLANESIDRAIALSRAARTQARGESRKQVEFTLERLERIQGLFRLGETILNTLLSKLRFDVTKYLDILKSSS